MSCDAFLINLDTNAVSKWLGVTFIRTWKLNGSMYGIAADGVYLIDGDGSTQCDVELAPTDFDDDYMKRLPYAAINGKGSSTVTPIYDGVDGTAQTTQFTDNMRVKFGRGAKGRFLSVKSSSSDPDFRVEGVNLYPEKLSRRV